MKNPRFGASRRREKPAPLWIGERYRERPESPTVVEDDPFDGNGRDKRRHGHLGRRTSRYRDRDIEEIEHTREDWENARPFDEDESPRFEPVRRPASRTQPQPLSLLDLSADLFYLAGSLPYPLKSTQALPQQFRSEVIAAIDRLREGATTQGVPEEDVDEAVYAITALIDEPILASSVAHEVKWEPLNRDPNSGNNFFDKHLPSLRDRDVKEIFLTCLAFGYRGRYGSDLDQPGESLGRIRQRLLRSIHAEPRGQRDFLFPESYAAAEPIDDKAPTRMSWLLASMIATAGILIIWLALYVLAGRLAAPAEQVVRGLLGSLP